MRRILRIATRDGGGGRLALGLSFRLPCNRRPRGAPLRDGSRRLGRHPVPEVSFPVPPAAFLSPWSYSLPAKPAPTFQLWASPTVGDTLKIGPERIRLDEQRSRLGEKLTDIANQWDGLLAFLYDGRVEMDSNFVENRIRPVKLTAKNPLFSGHDEGAAAWGRIASLIQTCKRNGVQPYAWLKSALEKIAGGHPQSCIRELLPWHFDPASS